MRNIPCNTAWTRRQKRWPYWDAGSAPQQVNLPDDFVLEKPRTPTAPPPPGPRRAPPSSRTRVRRGA